MPGLTEQRLIIGELEGRVSANRSRLIEAVRSVDLPVDGAMVAAGTAMIVSDLVPIMGTVSGFFFSDRKPGSRSKQLLKLVLEVPLLVQSLSRLK